MGLKSWLAGSVSGPQGYGTACGPRAREGGSALANLLFISHGRGDAGKPPSIFDAAQDMEAAGLHPRFSAIVPIKVSSLDQDERLLLRSLQIGMIAYAFLVNSNAALQYMRRDNTSKFRHGLGPAVINSMVECGLFDSTELAQGALLSYMDSVGAASARTVFNRQKPASGDLLEYFIARSVRVSDCSYSYGFVRTGPTGFDVAAVPLVEETLRAILEATDQYKW